MVRSTPDSALYYLSSTIKNSNQGVFRVTFKRGGVYKQEHAKAHSRKAKQQLKQQLKKTAEQTTEQLTPLLIRVKGQEKHLNCETKTGKGLEFASQLLNVFRVAFFNNQAMKVEKPVKAASRAVPGSKSSIKKQKRNLRNKERRHKLKTIQRNRKRESRANKNTKETAPKLETIVEEAH